MLVIADRYDMFDHFSGLPVELRNNIYQYVCVPNPGHPLQHSPVPAICMASRQLRKESLPLFFGLNTFILTVHGKFFKIPYYNTSAHQDWEYYSESHVNAVDSEWLLAHKRHLPLMRRFIISLAYLDIKYRMHYCFTHICFSQTMQSFNLSAGEIYEELRRGILSSWKQRVTTFPHALEYMLGHILGSGSGMTAAWIWRMLYLFVDMCQRQEEPESFESFVSECGECDDWQCRICNATT